MAPKRNLFILVSLQVSFIYCFSQTVKSEDRLLQVLDSISQSNSVSKHFGELYYNTTVIADNFFSKKDSSVQHFMNRLECRFADLFISAADCYNAGIKIPENWSVYYSSTSFSRLQYFLLGANAHINGDIWKALTTEFSLKEIETNRHEYFQFYHGLKKIFQKVHQTGIDSSKNYRLLYHISLGLDKVYEKMMLKRWRRRQMHLAILFFTNKKRFEKKLKVTQGKMDRLNKMICRKLH